MIEQQAMMDERLMQLALRLGLRSSGNTAENPAVGCVLATFDASWNASFDTSGATIVGRGWTQPGGRPHAERVALAEAGEKAKGATAYVTLEPCSHFGKTGPCSQALIDAGIARVVCAHPDPDPRVAGRGFSMLRDAGIIVETGLLQNEARLHLAGFLSRNLRKRPWVSVKMAFSKDGMIGKPGIGNWPVTGPIAKAKTYRLRSMADAILIGAETALVDDPSLTVRAAGLKHTNPIRVILDSRGRMTPDLKLVQSAKDVPTHILTSTAIDVSKAAALEGAGCHVTTMNKNDTGHIDLASALAHLASVGINKLMVEAGAALSHALLQAGLVDEFYLYQSPQIIGEEGLQALDGQPIQSLKAHGFRPIAAERLGDDEMTHFIRPDSLQSLQQ